MNNKLAIAIIIVICLIAFTYVKWQEEEMQQDENIDILRDYLRKRIGELGEQSNKIEGFMDGLEKSTIDMSDVIGKNSKINDQILREKNRLEKLMKTL